MGANGVLIAMMVLAMVSFAGLLVQARTRAGRAWAFFMLVSFPLGAWLWLWLPTPVPRALLALPLVALALGVGIWLAWQEGRSGPMPSQGGPEGEAWTTQEALQGPAGTRRVLALYFGLLLVVALGMLLLALWAGRGP